MQKQQLLSVRDAAYIAVAAAVIAVMAQIAIPMPVGVPFTLQTLAVPLIAAILGAKRGILAVVVYLLIGLLGVPVFSNFGAGFAVLIGRTGGFLFSFPFFALLVGLGYRSEKWYARLSTLVAGYILMFTMGMLQFMLVTGSGLLASFYLVVAPFLLLDGIKLVIVFLLAGRLQSKIS